MTIKEKMIDYIRRNRVSSTEIADCLGKQGGLEGIHALNPRHFEAGEIHYLFAVEESNWTVHEDLQGEVSDKIIFIDGIDVNGRAIIGDLVAKYILFYKENRAIVSNGRMRDAHTLVKERWGVLIVPLSGKPLRRKSAEAGSVTTAPLPSAMIPEWR